MFKKILQNLGKELKSVTAFDLFTFFSADLIQLEASWKLYWLLIG